MIILVLTTLEESAKFTTKLPSQTKVSISAVDVSQEGTNSALSYSVFFTDIFH